jgi:hypothetical protein
VTDRIHYTGPLAWTVGRMTTRHHGGTPVCNTHSESRSLNPELVTCKHCLRCMRLAGLIESKTT